MAAAMPGSLCAGIRTAMRPGTALGATVSSRIARRAETTCTGWTAAGTAAPAQRRAPGPPRWPRSSFVRLDRRGPRRLEKPRQLRRLVVDRVARENAFARSFAHALEHIGRR